MLLSSWSSLYNYANDITAFSHACYQPGVSCGKNGGEYAKLYLAEVAVMNTIVLRALSLQFIYIPLKVHIYLPVMIQKFVIV